MVGEHRSDCGSEWETMTSIAAKIGCKRGHRIEPKTVHQFFAEIRRKASGGFDPVDDPNH